MLEHFFGSKTRLRLLKTFFRSPERAFYVRELARLVETQLHAVRREIDNLERLSLIAQVEPTAHQSSESGTERSKYYQLNSDCFLYAELKALLMKGELFEQNQLIEEVKLKGGTISLLMLTGIFTNETNVSTDMLIVGTIKPTIIAKIIKQYEADLNKSIRYTLMDEKEFKDRRHVGDKFLYTVFEAKHIFAVNEFNLT